MDNTELYHFGIKGMKWGVRRYQNKDGSFTSAGKKRMYRDMFDAEGKENKERKKYVADPNKWVKEDMTKSKNVIDSTRNLTGNAKTLNDISMRNKSKNRPKMDLSNMSDKELRDQINRAFLEKQYNDMFNPPQVSKGREYASQILETAGAVLGVAGGAVGLALSIRELTKG